MLRKNSAPKDWTKSGQQMIRREGHSRGGWWETKQVTSTHPSISSPLPPPSPPSPPLSFFHYLLHLLLPILHAPDVHYTPCCMQWSVSFTTGSNKQEGPPAYHRYQQHISGVRLLTTQPRGGCSLQREICLPPSLRLGDGGRWGKVWRFLMRTTWPWCLWLVLPVSNGTLLCEKVHSLCTLWWTLEFTWNVRRPSWVWYPIIRCSMNTKTTRQTDKTEICILKKSNKIWTHLKKEGCLIKLFWWATL